MRASLKKIANPLMNCFKSDDHHAGSVNSEANPRASQGSHLSGLTSKLGRKTSNEPKELRPSIRLNIKNCFGQKFGRHQEEPVIPFFAHSAQQKAIELSLLAAELNALGAEFNDLKITEPKVENKKSGATKYSPPSESSKNNAFKYKFTPTHAPTHALLMAAVTPDRDTLPLAPKPDAPGNLDGLQRQLSGTSLDSSPTVIDIDSEIGSEGIPEELKLTPASSFASLGSVGGTHIKTEESLDNNVMRGANVAPPPGSTIATSDDTSSDTSSAKT
jgi:hypothetical protein